jgi:plasmid stabilization system protein ParE
MVVFWTDRAKKDLAKLEDYLIDEWNEDVLANFYEILEAKIAVLQSGTVVHQLYEDTKFHKMLITKHNSIIYEIIDNQVNILNMINNFKNPDSNYKTITKKK